MRDYSFMAEGCETIQPQPEVSMDNSFDIEKRDPNQTLAEWQAEILVNSTFERWQIPGKLYEQMYSARETIGYMRETITHARGPGRPRQSRNAEYVKRRIADLIWKDCSRMLGESKMLADGRAEVIYMQEWAEKNGSRFKAAKAE